MERPAGSKKVRAGEIRVGLIADTHGLLRPAAREFLLGATHIVHAGDLGKQAILDELQSIAPVTVVRGNNDSQPWAVQFPFATSVDFGEVRVYVIHNLTELDIDPAAAGVRVIVTGHSHKPTLAERGRILFVNPGSAGPRRFKLPIAIGELLICGRSVQARIVDLATSQLLATGTSG
jgi:putative phosphoesterase